MQEVQIILLPQPWEFALNQMIFLRLTNSHSLPGSLVELFVSSYHSLQLFWEPLHAIVRSNFVVSLLNTPIELHLKILPHVMLPPTLGIPGCHMLLHTLNVGVSRLRLPRIAVVLDFFDLIWAAQLDQLLQLFDLVAGLLCKVDLLLENPVHPIYFILRILMAFCSLQYHPFIISQASAQQPIVGFRAQSICQTPKPQKCSFRGSPRAPGEAHTREQCPRHSESDLAVFLRKSHQHLASPHSFWRDQYLPCHSRSHRSLARSCSNSCKQPLSPLPDSTLFILKWDPPPPRQLKWSFCSTSARSRYFSSVLKQELIVKVD